MTLLDPQAWSGLGWTGGWQRLSGGEIPVKEPATGEVLGSTGFADASDIARSAEAAAAAQ
ncbi:benzaldehyde dehydrogenase, partial [Streptomyces sp. SID5475]|nr:benzaldehyde dehydrogenase [Streptomyces sp. SID5475]